MILSTRFKIGLAKMLAAPIRLTRRTLGAPDDIVEVTRRGLRWHLDLNEGIDFSIYLLGEFEAATVRGYEQLIRPGGIVLDIGANIGAHTMPLARAVGERGEVHAFEPTAWAYSKLTENLGLNPALQDRVHAAQIMLSAKDAEELDAAIYSSWPLSAAGTRHEGHLGQLKSTEGARAMTLDSYIRDAKLKRIDFVKIDVDGHECDVFDGWQSFDEFRPTIVMEFAPYVLAERNCSLQHLIERFERAEYELRELGSGKILPLDATALDRLIGYGRGINVIARPCVQGRLNVTSQDVADWSG